MPSRPADRASSLGSSAITVPIPVRIASTRPRSRWTMPLIVVRDRGNGPATRSPSRVSAHLATTHGRRSPTRVANGAWSRRSPGRRRRPRGRRHDAVVRYRPRPRIRIDRPDYATNAASIRASTLMVRPIGCTARGDHAVPPRLDHRGRGRDLNVRPAAAGRRPIATNRPSASSITHPTVGLGSASPWARRAARAACSSRHGRSRRSSGRLAARITGRG